MCRDEAGGSRHDYFTECAFTYDCVGNFVKLVPFALLMLTNAHPTMETKLESLSIIMGKLSDAMIKIGR